MLKTRKFYNSWEFLVNYKTFWFCTSATKVCIFFLSILISYFNNRFRTLTFFNFTKCTFVFILCYRRFDLDFSKTKLYSMSWRFFFILCAITSSLTVAVSWSTITLMSKKYHWRSECGCLCVSWQNEQITSEYHCCWYWHYQNRYRYSLLWFLWAQTILTNATSCSIWEKWIDSRHLE